VPFSKYADRIQLVFAGKGPKYDEYVEMGKQLPNPPQFVFLTKDELIHLLAQTDLYVHASDMESEAISCIEAFATGLVPVIANSEDSATPQFALDGRSLFAPGRPKDLARAIDWWLDHPEEKERMEHEYAEAAKQYNIDESVRRCEGMFREAIEEMKQH
jgi:glycosyltransferase involved in cell wall biosynthesis